jgi:60 kDa SS-A/Ro ribonucleoprotein
MANKSVFAGKTGRLLPRTDAENHEGAPAFAFGARHKLAQLAMTGTFNDGFYAQAQEQMGDAFNACEGVPPEFLAKNNNIRLFVTRRASGGGNCFTTPCRR